jgi:hypothetical protein
LLSGGRLVVQPTVSWLEKEYAALGVPRDVGRLCQDIIRRVDNLYP